MDNKFDNKLLEEMIVCFSLKNPEFLDSIKDYITTKSYKNKSYFDDIKNQIIFNFTSNWYNKYNTLPSLTEAKIFIDRYFKEDLDLKIYLNTMLEKYYSVDISKFNKDYLLMEVDDFIKQASMLEAFAIARQDFDNKDYDSFIMKLQEANISVFKNNYFDTIINSNENIEAIIKQIEDEENIKKITTGYKQLDNILDGGFRPSNFYVFAAKSGGGKSIMLLQFAINAVKNGNRVLYISLEMDKLTLNNRINLNLLSDEYNDKNAFIVASKYNKEMLIKDLKATREELKGELVIFTNSLLGSTANDYKKILKSSKFDMVVIDYIGIMSSYKHPTEENPHFKYKYIAEELRELSLLFNIPILTANQLNAEGYKINVNDLSLTNLAYSTGISHTADFVAAIGKDGDNLKVLKSRSGITPILGITFNMAKYKILSISNFIEESKEIEKCIKVI